MMKMNWFFAENPEGTKQGYSDAGMETFRRSPYSFIARECIQNSLDAHDGSQNPVIVHFLVKKVTVRTIPGIEQLRQAITDCQRMWKGNKKAAKFFQGALKLLKKEKLPILIVSDRNTNGLTDEALEVASRQLTFMEEYVKRFLAVGINGSDELKWVDVHEWFDSTCLLLTATAKHAKVELKWDIPPTGTRIWGDPAALQQLIINLVLNAIEVVSMNSTVDAARVLQVNIIVETNDSCLVIDICDNGRGPSPEIQSMMFEALVSDKPDGVGMGLSVARDIVERQGGTVEWRRDSGWTIFTARLPLNHKDSTHAEADGR